MHWTSLKTTEKPDNPLSFLDPGPKDPEQVKSHPGAAPQASKWSKKKQEKEKMKKTSLEFVRWWVEMRLQLGVRKGQDFLFFLYFKCMPALQVDFDFDCERYRVFYQHNQNITETCWCHIWTLRMDTFTFTLKQCLHQPAFVLTMFLALNCDISDHNEIKLLTYMYSM